MSPTAEESSARAADVPAVEPLPAGLSRLRRAGALGCAALLAAATALAVSPAAPSPTKTAGGAFVEMGLTLEAEPVKAGESFRLGSGVTLVSNAVVTKAGSDPFSESPLCASYPVAPGSYRVSSPYGYRVHPIFGTYTMHMGVDYAAPLGTPIHAVTDGTVVYTGAGRLGRSSELVIIEHTVAGTTFYSWYVHMYPDGIFVEVGQHVRAGEVIAEVGNNGNSTGPHLHFEIHTSDAGLGLTKTPVRRTPASLVLSAVPVPGGPTDEPDDPEKPTDPEEPEDPEDPEKPTGPEDPTDPGDPTDPSDPKGPTDPEDPTDPNDPKEPTDPEDPTDPPEGPADPEDPTDPPEEPTDPEDPTDPPEEPADPDSPEGPTDPPEEPTDPPSPEPRETPTPEPTEDPITEEPTEQPTERPRNPFPTRAYGTTVDPVAFLASLGLTLVAPNQCTAP